MSHIKTFAKKEGFSPLTEECENILLSTFETLCQRPGWANGRDVKHFWELVSRKRASRVIHLKSLQSKEIAPEDLSLAADEMISSRPLSSLQPPIKQKSAPPPMTALDQLPKIQPKFSTNMGMAPHTKEEKKSEKLDQIENEKEQKEESKVDDWFGMSPKDLQLVNDILTNNGMTTEDIIKEISEKGPAWDKALKLLENSGVDLSTAERIMEEYRNGLKESFKEKEESDVKVVSAFELTKIMQRPIVQCQELCKRTANYWAPCFVAPKIIGYEEIEVPLLS